MRRPVNSPYTITTEFGVPDSYAKFGRHSGVDYAVPLNRPVYAPVSGQLTNVVSPTGGNMVVIKDNQGFTHRLMHNNSFSRGNGAVNEGDQVALAGTTGLSTGVHSHWDINKEGTYPTSFSSFINPADWLAGKYQSTQGANMADKTNLNTARILGETILGRDRNLTHSGKGDADLNANHVNRDLTNDYVYKLWTSPEAQAAAAREASYKKFYDTYSSKIAELSVRPTKEELAKLGESLKAEQAKVVAAEKKLAEEQAKKTEDTVLLDEAGNWLTKLFNRIFKKG